MLIGDGLGVAEGLRTSFAVSLHPHLGSDESPQGIPSLPPRQGFVPLKLVALVLARFCPFTDRTTRYAGLIESLAILSRLTGWPLRPARMYPEIGEPCRDTKSSISYWWLSPHPLARRQLPPFPGEENNGKHFTPRDDPATDRPIFREAHRCLGEDLTVSHRPADTTHFAGVKMASSPQPFHKLPEHIGR